VGEGTAVLAVSGGPDSLALLDLMAGSAAELGLALLVAHADHGILPNSAQIAERVRALAAERYGLPCVIGTLGLGAGASETRARSARYACLRRVQDERGARYLVTAHHADDQAETVLLRLLRGSAPAGLAGIPARGPRGLVRPLLPFSRAELRAYVVARDLPFTLDPSNADLQHTRAWVRGRLVPVLEERLGSGARTALLEVARHAGQDCRAWDHALDALPDLALRVTAERFDVARAPLARYDNVLTGRILRAVARRAGLRLGPRAARRLAEFARGAASGRRVELGERLIGEIQFDRVAVARAEPAAAAPVPVVLGAREGRAAFGDIELAWRHEPAPEHVPREGWSTWVADGDPPTVRGLAAGDRVRPLGGVGHRPVRRLLMEARIPRGARAAWPLLARGDDVLWVPGVCRAAAAVPSPGALALRIDARTR